MPAPLGEMPKNGPKGGDGMNGPPGYHQPHYNQGHFSQQPPYGPPPQQFPPNNGYMGWHNGQQQPPPYGGHNAPGWAPGQGPPHNMGMYRQGGPPPSGMGGPDRAFGGYRGGPPSQPPSRRPPSQPEKSPPRKSGKGEGPPPGYWGQQQQQQQQWPQHQWGPGSGGAGGGPPMWQGGPPQPGSSPPNMPQHMQGPPKLWAGNRNGMTSPTRTPRRSPEPMPSGMMGPNGYRGTGGMDYCKATAPGMEDVGSDMYDKKLSQADKDKGRGSYRCGRCGAPKKGHVCPYQPKLKRRPDEPPPEMRNAAIQVEMDEFMTLRRLNIEIQGFPESYATSPHMGDSMVVGEPHPLALQVQQPIMSSETPAVTPKGPSSTTPRESPEVLRSSPISTSPLVD
mmetsp:Transcript_4311/g.6725  ORF Transcript_4311/g.6725 Transcript_4311/m.6725 type:complete len:393 (-) Transcript_4311:212-1390(-)|eukprot:CAMPEP_0178926858 /NCGR_PEP_ID=MMETSP0786-20121207/18798_1 /TAXON_ID=186022 /ORGANISM="Thalassionema frauenfeldii, Strain CCMP 1798" /LENGTH=392 /DNA_ID=CAMNT_0020602091 /DNA_START=207 /DNA_END=1385 /DNA_ORIENTATION=-